MFLLFGEEHQILIMSEKSLIIRVKNLQHKELTSHE